jgi:alkyldihydroxyacetonephosphate synthase
MATARQPARGNPTPPIAIEAGDGPVRSRLAPAGDLPPAFLSELAASCDGLDTAEAALAEAGRDWWPLAMQWALEGQVPALPAVIARPTSAEQVAAVLRLCTRDGIPVTAAGGRSGVVGASVPLHGGVVLDLTAMNGIVSVDDASLTVTVLPGTFGDAFEETLRGAYGLTLGHWPQSIALSTVGGWLACRSAGQLSTRYGKIEDMVVSLEVVLADGSIIRTGDAPRAAVGPDLDQLFVGSEGTLGIITEATLRCRPVPPETRSAAWGFASFAEGLDACRRILRRGATPAVLRLYDATESDRSYQTGDRHVLLVLDEGEAAIVDATMHLVGEECEGADVLDAELVDRWLSHRNDVSALEALTRRGYVVDTMEIAAPWGALPAIYDAATAAILAVPGATVASAHQSHSYLDGACLYFTFAGRPDADDRERFYVEAWDAGTRAVLEAGGALSHHHGVGLNRSRFVHEALGGGMVVLQAVKDALDPRGVLNPGKLGLESPFGEVPWPAR